jgi:hypothetical protein
MPTLSSEAAFGAFTFMASGDEATLQAGFQDTLGVVAPWLACMAAPAFVPDAQESPFIGMLYHAPPMDAL